MTQEHPNLGFWRSLSETTVNRENEWETNLDSGANHRRKKEGGSDGGGGGGGGGRRDIDTTNQST